MMVMKVTKTVVVTVTVTATKIHSHCTTEENAKKQLRLLYKPTTVGDGVMTTPLYLADYCW